ncbi:hypothetical protein PENSOL_c022G06704 [Penicillium solitum]|uniref:GPI inositol-deacylase winged helix domain-containing protein n=1 Tax=Penicillium solitum TaxID=60172 RepID=A0A1V6R1J2_9EURO|nr:uncharacterized protein PENSOL_c022G06704 [Penicillium solitum]OQD95096.1 hypothetical protein PENSOL_c022G06704 [Penicillium solitum]
MYGCALELLATSSDLSSNTAVQFCQAIFDPKKPSDMLLKLEKLEQELAKAAGKCEDTAHAHQEATFKSYLQEAQDSLNRITRHMEHVFQWVNDQEWRELLEWVSNFQYGRHHDEIEERREPNTGDWLVQDKRFCDWMNSPSDSTLWLQGSPSLLGFSECRRQLVESFNLYSISVIILDGLDEVLDDELDILIEALDDAIAETKDRGKVKLFVASRPEKNIAAKYGSSSTIIIQAQDNEKDIEKYVTNEMNKFGRKHPKSDVNTMKSTIIRAILDKCDNMFLWAALQVKQIIQCNTVDSIHYALENLPKGLDEMYDQIYRKIHTRFPPEQAIAERALKWVLCTPYPLTSEELLSAACMCIEKENMKLSSCIQQESLLSICENLVVVDTDGRWRYFHLSAREYLEKTYGIYQQAHFYCAQVCLLSLMRTFGPATLPGSSEDPFNQAHPFSRHTQTCWIVYVIGQTENDQYVILLKKFLDSPDKSSVLYIRWLDQLSGHDIPFYFIHEYGDLLPATTPMFAIAHFSLYEETLREWCDSNDFDPSQQNNRGDDLLTIAAMNNCVPLCTALIAKGVNVNQCRVNSRYNSVLAAAAWNNSLDTVKYLVEEAKADVNLPPESGNCGCALAAAAMGGNLDILRYFAEVKPAVDLLVHVRIYGNVLATAAFASRLDVVRYLVEEANIDVNLQLGEYSFGSVLVAATWGSLAVVKYLMEEAKAGLNVPHGANDALVAAILSGNVDIVRYFVEEIKADVGSLVEQGLIDLALETHSNEDAVALREILKLPSDQEPAGDEH